jgi:hypothetical protein
MRMPNPPHPGAVLREYLGDLPVTAAAEHLGVSRVTLSRVLNGVAGEAAQGAQAGASCGAGVGAGGSRRRSNGKNP